jgi:transcriptional regulator with XRE-family HTH domain
MGINQEIGARIKEYAITNYGSMKAFAKALPMSPAQLSQLVHGRNRPGYKVQEKFRRLGMDVEWAMTGLHREDVEKRFKALLDRDLADGITKEDKEMLTMLHQLRIKTIGELAVLIGPEKVAQRLVELQRKQITLKAAEGMGSYDKKRPAEKRGMQKVQKGKT